MKALGNDAPGGPTDLLGAALGGPPEFMLYAMVVELTYVLLALF